MSVQALTEVPSHSHHTFTDSTGSYRIDRLFLWINNHQEQHKTISIIHLLEYVIHDTWDNFSSLKRTNFRVIFDDQGHQRRMKNVDLAHPIIITNFNRLVDGVHRLFKAIFEKQENIKVVFISPFQLSSVRVTPAPPIKSSQVSGLPIEDVYLSLPKKSLPSDSTERRSIVEDYFPDHLPTATPTQSGFELCLERPSSPYGSFSHDDTLTSGLSWWKSGTRVRDICAEYRLLNDGILALEEQWIPLSWSRLFQRIGKIPEEIVLLHLDDHQDMMPPRIGKRLDGEMVDYITGNHIDFMDPDSVKKAIISGAIGKGSILTPLIWMVPKIHVRHLTFRAHPNTTYKIDKVNYSDGILFNTDNRIGLHFSDTSWENLTQQSNYVVTPNPTTWLDQIPSDIPVLLHFDLDYFNNRFDGNSNWETDPHARSFNPRFSKQKHYLSQVFKGLKKHNLMDRIIDTSIGISPGFYPGEFWQQMVTAIGQHMPSLNIQTTQEVKMSIRVTRSMTRAQNQVKQDVSSSSQQPKSSAEGERVSTSAKRTFATAMLSKDERDKPKVRKKQKVKKVTREVIAPSPRLSSAVSESNVSVVRMASKKFEGSKVKLVSAPCGYVKFYPKVDKVFKRHVTVDFKIPQKHRGKHIGRFALRKAIRASDHTLFVGHLRKSNIASKKALAAVGFTSRSYPGSNQLCMAYKK